MFRTLIMFALLRRLRLRSPELFDGARALAAINACIEQDLAGFDVDMASAGPESVHMAR